MNETYHNHSNAWGCERHFPFNKNGLHHEIPISDALYKDWKSRFPSTGVNQRDRKATVYAIIDAVFAYAEECARRNRKEGES
ncbi:MAG: hypothetical protein WCD79_08020 [Chthoniobacteraceae bacterium]